MTIQEYFDNIDKMPDEEFIKFMEKMGVIKSDDETDELIEGEIQ